MAPFAVGETAADDQRPGGRGQWVFLARQAIGRVEQM